MRMPWGKFRGKNIDELPSWYLLWLAEHSKDDKIATEADTEWRDREKWNEHWKYDEDNVESF